MAGTFIEELFSPIPSFVVLIPAGAAANSQELSIYYLGVLAIFSAFGRIAAAVILYFLADKFEDRLLSNGRRLFGISHKEVENLGRRLGAAGKRDGIVLFAMNAVPIFPTGALSVACGFIKVRFRLFVLCTFFGTMINSLIYMSVGYFGAHAASALRGLEWATRITAAVIAVLIVLWFLRHRQRQTRRRGGAS